MELYLVATLKGSPKWERMRKLKQWDRVAALRDADSRKAFEAKYGHPPEVMTADEVQEPHN